MSLLRRFESVDPLGCDRYRDTTTVGEGGRALHQTAAFQVIDQPRDPALTERSLLGELGHAQAVLWSEYRQDFVGR